jgi:GNAT superfamily N-acetyltransferase
MGEASIWKALANQCPAPEDVTYRETARPGDVETVRRMVAESGFFSEEETGVAVELVEERLSKGDRSGYFFVFAERAGRVLGYTCHGPIPGTLSSQDLYWIVVDPALRGRSLGKHLLARTEEAARRMGAARMYAETSSREQYTPTRAFYGRCGYKAEAVLKDYYRPGEDMVMYSKVLLERFISPF